MEKVLFCVTFKHNEPNSVALILSNILKNIDKKNLDVRIAIERTDIFSPLEIVNIDNEIYYLTDSSKRNMLGKIHFFINKSLRKIGLLKINPFALYLKKIKRRFNFSKIIFFIGTPKVDVCNYLYNHNIQYSVILYDKWLSRPYKDNKKIINEEKHIIMHSHSYYVPNFFFNNYQKEYMSDKIHPYYLPLLIEKEEVDKYSNADIIYQFSYFGQLQYFRNVENIEIIFRSLNLKLDIFTDDIPVKSYRNYIFHKSIVGDSLLKATSQSRFLVVFDNAQPYEDYLPSKVIQYVSFTKPIIVFGTNKESAIRSFLNDYSCWYYHFLGSPLSGLLNFIKRNSKYNFFSTEDYSKYLHHLPKNVIRQLDF